jgi:biopolymer transport protein ExbD
MRRSIYQREDRGRLDVKMTPMIDVVFLLLVFFVATASFQGVEQILPTSVTIFGTGAEAAPVDPQKADLGELVIEVLWRDGKAARRINGVEYQSLDQVRRVLVDTVRIQPDIPVILDVEDAVPMQDVIDVYDLCRSVSLAQVQFAVAASTAPGTAPGGASSGVSGE